MVEELGGGGIGAQRIGEPGLDLGPEPAPDLPRALGGELAAVLERLAMASYRLPDRIDALLVQGRAGEHLGRPGGRRRPQQLQRRAVVGLRALRRGEQLAVGLVDHHEIGELDDAALDALQLVAGAGREQQQKAVDHVGDRALALADADGLDHHHVEARPPRRPARPRACVG